MADVLADVNLYQFLNWLYNLTRLMCEAADDQTFSDSTLHLLLQVAGNNFQSVDNPY